MDAAILQEIEAALEQRVRPQLNAHHGDVIPVDFSSGILKVRLTGKCGGCPLATITTQTLIAEEVRAAVPAVTEVVLLSGVSDELLGEARELLARRPR